MNVFITGVGGDLAQNVISCLRKIENVKRIVGSDICSNNSGAFFVDQFVLISKPDGQNYLSLLLKFFNECNIDCFIPLSQKEIEFFSNLDQVIFNQLFEKVKFIGLDHYIVQTFLDKLETSKWLKQSGFVTPDLYRVEEIPDAVFPVIVKPRFGSGSKGVHKAINLEQVKAAILLTKDPIIQQFVDQDDSEFTVGIFSNRLNTKVISFRRLIAGSGATSWARHEVHESIIKMGLTLANKLNLLGSINVQLRIKDHNLFIFEINPRFSSTVLMRSELGFNDVAWSLGDYSSLNSFDSMLKTGAEFATYVRPIRIN
jgi:carbamoyl-phosphate synthase large subunit